jgi:hypothetical protein
VFKYGVDVYVLNACVVFVVLYHMLCLLRELQMLLVLRVLGILLVCCQAMDDREDSIIEKIPWTSLNTNIEHLSSQGSC